MHKVFQPFFLALSFLLLVGCSSAPATLTIEEAATEPKTTQNLNQVAMNCQAKTILIKTNLGDMRAEIYPDKVPETAKNFCYHIEKQNYDNNIFHRVIKDFMIQTGDFENHNGTGGYSYKGPGTTIAEEFHKDLSHQYGALSMAKTMFPSTTGSQFFIVHAKEGTPWLDQQHSVFGQVVDGLDILEQIAEAETKAEDVPLQEIKIHSIQFAE